MTCARPGVLGRRRIDGHGANRIAVHAPVIRQVLRYWLWHIWTSRLFMTVYMEIPVAGRSTDLGYVDQETGPLGAIATPVAQIGKLILDSAHGRAGQETPA